MTFGISLDWVFVKIAFDWVELVSVGLVLFFALYACFFLSMFGVDLLTIFGVFVDEFDCCLEGLNNVAVIADDILIYGTGDPHEESVSSHDDAMRALLKRCRERNIKLNKKKLRFKMDEVSYMGHKLTKSGLSPCPDKVRPIVDMEKPRDIAGVQRLISVVTYLSKFLPRLSTVCEPLRRLTDKDAVFDWLPQHEEAFKTVKP